MEIPKKKKKSDFEIPGYNDQPKHCPFGNCNGMVMPTYNCNVGKCDKCGKSIGWNEIAESC